MRNESVRLADATYVELVQRLFDTLPPTLVMSGLFIGVGIVARDRVVDMPLFVLTVVGALLSAVRIAFVMIARGPVARLREREAAVPFERGFALTYLPFALALGLFGARLLGLPRLDMHSLAVVLITGYCAGASSGVYVRPAIAVGAMVLAVAPSVAMTAYSLHAPDRMLGLVLTIFTLGGIGTVVSRYRADAMRSGERLKLATVPRFDAMTSLPNRLALLEEYDGAVRARGGERSVWLHCIGFDGLAEVNLTHGLAAGDRLIKLAASRLGSVVADGGLPARLGGVEFAVLQSRLGRSGEAEELARRMAEALDRPYPLDDGEVRLVPSIGYACDGDAGGGLDRLIDRAEEAMLRARRDGGRMALAAG